MPGGLTDQCCRVMSGMLNSALICPANCPCVSDLSSSFTDVYRHSGIKGNCCCQLCRYSIDSRCLPILSSTRSVDLSAGGSYLTCRKSPCRWMNLTVPDLPFTRPAMMSTMSPTLICFRVASCAA